VRRPAAREPRPSDRINRPENVAEGERFEIDPARPGLLRILTGDPGRPELRLNPHAIRPFVLVGLPAEQIADALRIARSTFYEQRGRDVVLQELWRQWEAERRFSVARTLYGRAARGNSRLILHLAEHDLGQRRYRAVELTGKDGGPIEMIQRGRDTLETKLDALAERIEAGELETEGDEPPDEPPPDLP
jgi:hypothetical protein